MRFVEAVNRIEKRYGMQAFDHIKDYADDVAAKVIIEERKRASAKDRKKHARGKDPGPWAFRKMVENGYTYTEISVATGMSLTTVRDKSRNYGLRDTYYKLHPKVRKWNVAIECTNLTTGEKKTYATMSQAEIACGLRKAVLSDATRGGKAYVYEGWEFRRGKEE